jgi:phage-related protein
MKSSPEQPNLLYWIGQSRRDLSRFPGPVKQRMGYALYLAQLGDKHDHAKPFKGFGGAGVLEVVEDHDGKTFRAVYAVRFPEAVYVLHAFQKKSKKGVATPKSEIALIRQRLAAAAADYEERSGRPHGDRK